MGLFRRYKTIEEVLPGFLLQKEVAVQAKSFHPYIWTTRVFIDWLKAYGLDNQPMRRITSENVTNFFFYIGKDKKLDRTTCEKYFLDLRQLFQYAKRQGEVENIPFDNIIYPKKKKDSGAVPIQIEDLKILLPEIKRCDPQLYLACMIQYYCFIRPGKELRLMKVGDIDFHNGLITVRQELAKNKQTQSVTMPQQLIDICYEYGLNKADKNLYIFGNKKRIGTKPSSVNMLRWRFNKIRDRLKMPKSYKFYSFKHTGATALHISGAPMIDLMDQLRHSNLHATQHYLHKHCGKINDRIRVNFPSPI